MGRGRLEIALILGLATSLSACGFVTGLFPDKQKQYRYSSDIPELEIPPDLTASTIEGARQKSSTARPGMMDRESADFGGAGGEPPAEPVAPPAVEKPAGEPSAGAPTTLAQGADDVPLIEIEEPFAEAWNDVSRALGRLQIEVSDQNRSDGLFYVYYGGDTQKYEDRGLLADLAGLFTGGGSEAQEYRVKVEEKGAFTNVYVLDQSDKPVTEGAGFDLLKRLNETLQSLDKPESEPAEAKPEK